MKFKAWLSSSFVLLLALTGMVALFYYWDQPRLQSVQMLQNQLSEVELQRFNEEKGSQVQEAATQAAAAFNRLLAQYQGQVEALAQSPELRKVHKREADWTIKKQAFQQLTPKGKQWFTSILTDETGTVKVWAGEKKPPQTIAPTPSFIKAKEKLNTVVDFIEQAEREVLLVQFTTPCLSEQNVFLGVWQASIPIGNEDLIKITPKGGFKTIIATIQGKRLTRGPEDNFPESFGELLEKSPKEMEQLLQATEPVHFKVQWKETRYLINSVATQYPVLRVFTLLEVSGLERAMGPLSAANSMFDDPLLLAGLSGLLFFSLLLMFIFSGGAGNTIKRVNRQLLDMMQTGEELQPLEISAGGEWRKLADLVNQLIERSKNNPPTPATIDPAQDTEALERAQAEAAQTKAQLEEMRTSYEQVMTQNQELNQHLQDANEQQQHLQAALESSQAEVNAKDDTPPPATDARIEELLALFKEEGALRIEAISSMSEDLKATLMVIKNYISSILSSEDGKITDSQQEFLGVVINKSARLERQINDLLDVSHMESGVTQLYRSKTDLVSMIQDVVLNSQPQAETKQVKIVQEMQTPIPPILIDSDRIGQVFINLVQHAIKITPVGGEVRITGTETLTDIIVKIRDSGSPLSAEQAAKVFSEFHGAGSNAGPDIAGTGLRFPIIRRIVDSHQGTVAMRGLPEQGNETVVSFSKTSELIAPEKEGEHPSIDMFEVRPVEMPGATVTETTDSSYDLTSFMGKMDEYEIKSAPTEAHAAPSSFPGADEDLNKLLSDIEKINNKMD